jgi:hypothetical protein
MISCARCNRPAPVNLDELTGDGGGDASLLPVVVPPDGWIADPDDADGHSLVCDICATFVEEMKYRGDLVVVEYALSEDVLEDDDS